MLTHYTVVFVLLGCFAQQVQPNPFPFFGHFVRPSIVQGPGVQSAGITPPPGAHTLEQGQSLFKGQFIQSPNKQWQLTYMEDGRFCLSNAANHGTYWCSTLRSDERKNKQPGRLIMQYDGNLVAYDPMHIAQWASDSYNKGKAPYRTILRDDSSFCVVDGAGTELFCPRLMTGTGVLITWAFLMVIIFILGYMSFSYLRLNTSLKDSFPDLKTLVAHAMILVGMVGVFLKKGSASATGEAGTATGISNKEAGDKDEV
jgi:hypothetical protein